MPSGSMKAFVTFLCERFSLAIVAVGSVFMVLIFIMVEVNTTRLGSYGIVFRGDTDRVDVLIPQGPLRSGDRIDLQELTPEQRFSLMAAPGNAKITVHAVRDDGTRFAVTLSAALPEYSRRAELAREIGIPVCFFLSLGLASALFLMWPRASTLAFYVYAILMLLKVYQLPLDLAGWPLNLASDLLLQVIYPLTQLAILLFAQRLYGRTGHTWPWIWWPAVAAAVGAFLIWSDPIVWLTTQHFGVPGPATRILMSASDAVLLVVVLAGLAYIASGAEGLERTRVTWIVGGIALAPVVDLTWAAADIASAITGDASTALLALQAWCDALLPWFGLCGIVAVLYGFLSQRVVDLRLAIGRAAIYGAMTVVLVVIFGAIEWLAGQIFDSTRPAQYVSLIAALGIGFAMQTVHGRMEELLNRLLFRSQRRAEDALRRAARAIAHTTSEQTVNEFLIDEPVAILGLTAAAFYLAREEGERLVLTAHAKMPERCPQGFDPQDPLVTTLRSEARALALDERARIAAGFGSAGRLEALAIPLVMHGVVYGFAYYGERSDGAAFTSEERALLGDLVASACAAFDHIEADRARERIRELEARLQRAGVAT